MSGSLRLSRPRFLAYLALEGGLVFAVVHGLAVLTLRLDPALAPTHSGTAVLLAGALFMTILLLTQSASLGAQTSLRRELTVFSVLSLVTGSLIFAGLWLVFSDIRRLPALIFIEAALAVPAAVAAWRWLTVHFDLLNLTRESVLIVGTGETARQACRWIVEQHGGDYAVIGFVDEEDRRLGALLAMGARIQTTYDGLARFAQNRADRIIVALDEKRGKLPVQELMELRLLGVEIEDVTSFFERVSGRIAVETMLPSWLIFSEGFKTSLMRRSLKRTADIFHSLVLLLLTAPIMVLTAIAIKLESRGPILYRQTRLGMHGSEFDVLKFRSMRADAESASGPTWAQADDPRITRIGRIIRPLRIDELPQLFNVLKGQMSFVGPRPEREYFVRQLEAKLPYYGLRMTVRPGITGWAQVEYGYGASDGDALEKLKFDLYYIKNSNLFFDLWIVLKTIKVVLLGRGAR